MRKPALFLFVASVASTASLDAATIAWASVQDNGLALPDNSMLAKDNYIQLGWFDIDIATVQSNKFNLPFVESHFHALGSTQSGSSGVLGNPGYFTSSIDVPTKLSLGNGLAGKQLFVFAFSSSDRTSLAAGINPSNVTAYGIFSSNKSSWFIPTDSEDGFLANTTIDLSDLTTAVAKSNVLDPQALIVVGGASLTSANGSLNAPNFALMAIPEPGTAALALFGGTAMLLRRRRRL